jgi:glutamyl-tRNA reductase
VVYTGMTLAVRQHSTFAPHLSDIPLFNYKTNMLDGFHILTLTHKQVPLASIGQAMAPESGAESTLRGIKQLFGWDELYYLATCNRVMYLFYDRQPVPEALPGMLMEVLHPSWNAAEIEKEAKPMSLLHGAAAVEHLMEVASSMDSLVVGEREIIRQLREAYEQSKQWGLTGDHLRLLMRYTIETAKSIYTETGIGDKALSVVALAYHALEARGLRPDARILMVGAGQTNALFAKFLFKYGYHNVTVFNRSLDKAEALAEYIGGKAYALDQLPQYRQGFDALIVCTSATEHIVTEEIYDMLLGVDRSAKVAVDLSVPNNIDPALRSARGLHIIDIESLRAQAEINLAYRESERQKAAILIMERVQAFRAVWHERQVERSLSGIPSEIRAYKERAFHEVFSKELAQLDPQALDLVHRMMDYMEKKSVAVPMKAAKAIVLNMQKASKVAEKSFDHQ